MRFYKVQERAASLDCCPWCSSKGLTYPLHSYHINLEESVTLCTNSQCLFPLVSRSLEDVLTSLVPVEPATENKRKNVLTTVAQHPSAPSPKRLRVNEQDDPWSLSTAPTGVYNIVNNCNGESTEAHRENINGFVGNLDANQLEEKDTIISKDLDATPCADVKKVPITFDSVVLDPSKSLTTDNQQVLSFQDDRRNEDNSYVSTVEPDRSSNVPDGGVSPNKDELSEQTEASGTTKTTLPAEDASFAEVFQSKREDTSYTETNTVEFVPAPAEIFWKNVNNLCWLDSLLVALVNLKRLRKLKPKVDPGQSPMWTLLTRYEEACAALQSHQQTDENGCLKISDHVLHNINGDLETHRMSIFNILQPKLQCKLGQNETPVFALPLLVKMDSWLETLFQFTFYWDFKCTTCRSSTKQNVVKTLPTFTNIVPDWHPLKAVHLAPCNNCHRKNQRRKMVLQGVPPVFALHFVEGLPDNNIQIYSFSFNKRHYSVSAIIQYSCQYKHFVTWVHRSDGSWVEFDDLKHPHCQSYKTLPVPAQEIHVVFWEEEEEEQHQESQACSPSTTFTESPTCIITHSVIDMDVLGEQLLQCSPDQSLLNPQHDSDLMDAISEQDSTVIAGVDTSIGSTTLLEAFEGLSHNDIVTLELVEMKVDAKNPNDSQIKQVNEFKSQDLKDVIHKANEDTPAPDSSSTFGAKEKPKETDVDLSAVSELEDDFSDDPTFEPKSKRRKKKGRAAATKRGKTAKVCSPKGKVTSKVVKNAPRSPRTASSKPSSPVSSTVSTPQNVSKKVPQAPPVVQQQKGWSQLLERSLGHIQNTTSNFKSTQKQVTQETAGPIHSTPRQLTNGVPVKAVPKLGLRKEEIGGLPLKAAGMYGAFGSKNSKTNMLDLHTVQSPVEKPLSCNTVLNNSLNTSIIGLTSNATSLKKSKWSKMPPGLSETEALRYKLMKKLHAKKKKLAKLNEMLGQQRDGSFIPDSTNSSSPNTVTSSTLDDEFFSDLLSPATTITSTLSPDSTDFLEMLANGQEAIIPEEMPSNTVVQQSAAEKADLLDEFMSRAVAERPSEMEAEVLSALDLFL